jgi:hypothetical protein
MSNRSFLRHSREREAPPRYGISSGVAVLLVFEMGQLRHALVQDTWLPEVVAGGRPHRVLV